jgi:hypothetical protein
MTARCLPLSLLLLLGRAVPARADLKIITRSGTDKWSTTRTRYVQGRNWRDESHIAQVPRPILIYNADHQRCYMLDAAARAYTVRRVEQPKRTAPHRASESGNTLAVYLDTVDTGERRWMFGHLARHIIRSERRVSEPGSCSGAGDRLITTDGWYIDLPAAFPDRPALPSHRAAYLGIASARCNGTIDHIDFHETGPYENGFALLETRTTSDSPGEAFEVTELVEAPLDPKLFAPPADFHLVLFLPGGMPPGFWNTLRYGWASLIGTAEALLD